MLDSLLGREYSPSSYNCVHFCIDVWMVLKKQDISRELSIFLERNSRPSANYQLRKVFKKCKTPVSTCLALMHRNKCSPHLGVYHENKIIHLTENGVENILPELAARGFEKVTYYNVCSYHSN